MRYIILSFIVFLTACSPSTEEVVVKLGKYKSGTWAIVTEQQLDAGAIFDAKVYQDGRVVTVTRNGEWGCYWVGPGFVRPLTEEQALKALKNERGN